MSFDIYASLEFGANLIRTPRRESTRTRDQGSERRINLTKYRPLQRLDELTAVFVDHSSGPADVYREDRDATGANQCMWMSVESENERMSRHRRQKAERDKRREKM